MKQLKRLQLDPEKRIGDEELKNLRGGSDLNCFCVPYGYILAVFSWQECKDICINDINGDWFFWYG